MAGLKKLLKRHGGKKSAASSREDIASLAGEVPFGYSVPKEKELPKLHKAVWNGDVGKVKQLSKKSDINQFDKENRTPLHLSCACGLDEVTQFLLANKAKTNLCDNDGRTPLMKAVECSHLGCIQLLLEHNADVNVKDKNSSSPLHLAAANNLINVATRLLDKGLSVNTSDKEGFTALHVASSLGNQEFVLYLLNRGAHVDITDAHGRTPLMTAAADGHVDIVRMLIQHQADVSVKDAEGWKAADHAVMNGIHSCAKVIDDHETKQAKQRTPAAKKESPKKKPDITEVLRKSSPAVNEDLGFSFGGPATDKVSVDANVRSEGSTSRQSDADDSWASSSADENSEANKQTTKISLAAALKKVDKNVADFTNETSTIDKVKSPQTPSKIPLPLSPSPNVTADVALPHSQTRNSSAAQATTTLSPTASVKSVGSPSSVASPRGPSRVVSPSESVTSRGSSAHDRVNRRQSGASLPMEYLSATQHHVDSDQSSKGKDGAGYSPSFLSPRSDQSNRNLADELGLSLDLSEDDENFDDSEMSGEVALHEENHMLEQAPKKEEGKPVTLTSTTKPTENQATDSKNPAAYLGLDLGSSISSVSDPDISGIEDDNEKTPTKQKQTSALPAQPSNKTKSDIDDEDTDSNWDTSEGFLPSDNENVSGKAKSSTIPSNHSKELKAAVEKRRETLAKSGQVLETREHGGEESDGEMSLSEEDRTESESEWANEREDARKRELEKMRESVLTKVRLEEQRQKEVEEKLHIEMEKEKKEEQKKEEEEEQMKLRRQKEQEEQMKLRRQKEQEEQMKLRRQKEQDEQMKLQKQEEEKMKLRKQKEEEQMKLRKQKEQEQVKLQKQKEEQMKREKEKAEEIRIQKEKEALDAQKRKEEEEMLERRKEEEEMELERRKKEEEMLERRKEEGRRVEWERQQEEKERELAASIKKELEDEIGMEEVSDGSERQYDEESFSEQRKSGASRDREGQMGAVGDFEEEGSSQWDSSTDDEITEGSLETSGASPERNGADLEKRGIEEKGGNELPVERKKGKDFKMEKQMEVERERSDLNNNASNRNEIRNTAIKELPLVKEEGSFDLGEIDDPERTPTNEVRSIEGGIIGDKGGVIEDARRIQQEEDALLEAYKIRQEEMLEQERRMEEELARKEQERIDGLRLEMERRKVEEMRRMAELERERKEREAAALIRKQEEEQEMKKRLEKEKDMELKRRQETEEKRLLFEEKLKIEENKARAQYVESSSDLDRLPVSEELFKSKAEAVLTEKHRGFVDQAANSTALEVQKVQDRERLAGKSREIKERQAQAKADLDAVRLHTSRLAENPKVMPNVPESSPPRRSPLPNLDSTPPGGGTSEWSTSSEDDAPLPRVTTPLSSGDGGLGSSLSPGHHSAMRASLLQSVPLSTSPAIMDSSPVTTHLKNSLRDTKRQIEKYQERLSLAETQVKQLQSHADELQNKLDDMIQQKSVVERDMFELNEENRVLKHECSRALEEKRISDVLVDTFKDQVNRSEEKLNREIFQRRTVEEACKQQGQERLNIENILRQLSEEHRELKRALEREQEQCRLKDELYNEQKKQIEEVITESQKVSQHRADVLTKLESVDENRKSVEASSENMRKDLIHAKSEVSRLGSQLESVTKFSQTEVESYKAQLADQTEKIRHLEESLAKARSEYDTKLSQYQSSNVDQQYKLESQLSSKHSLESEAAVLRSRLETAENERNEANKTRVDTERQLHSLREEMYKVKSSLEKEISSLKETSQLSSLKLSASDNKISSLEAELQTANIMLTERSSQMSMNIRDVEHKSASITKLEAELRAEKESNSRLSAKFEATSEKLRDLESESSHLRRQLELASENVRKHESTSQETQNKLHSTISEIKIDYEKTKGQMSENERRLVDAVDKYKEEIQKHFAKQQLQDENIRNLQQELVEATRKQSVAEASLEIQSKAREHLEEERNHLRQTLREYEGQMTTKISENRLVTGRASVLENELEHSRQVSSETSQRLASTSYDLESLEKTKEDVDKTLNPAALENDIRKMKFDRAKLESTLNEEKAKADLLLREIRESNEGRTQLEALLAQIKSSNIDLQEQLQAESFNKSHHAREAEEVKGLWESELRARSKLGAKIVEMENKVNETKAAIEEEKNRTRKALESRKVLQGKLELYEKSSEEHQKDVQTLKGQIKAYKRRLKECEGTEKRIPNLQAEFNREIQQYEGNITSLRSQMRDLNEKLRQEGDLRAHAERKGQHQEKDCLLAKAQTKEQTRQVQKLEKRNRKIEEEMDRLREHYDSNFVEKAQMERVKMDIEAKSRIELNRKLAEVNAHLEEQSVARETLERSRNEQEALKLKEMENTISTLKRENEKYKSNFYQLQTEMQTREVEADRFKDMYESEAKRKQKLDDLLFKEREKSAESKALLNLERSRSSKFLGNSPLNTSFMENSPERAGIANNDSISARSPGLVYSQPKEKLMESVDKELSKSIQRHLDSISPNSPLDTWAKKDINMTSSPLSSSSNQYMETLKRNYFV